MYNEKTNSYDDEREELFKEYKYTNSDLEDMCSMLLDRMQSDFTMGDISFEPTELSAKIANDDNIRVDMIYINHGTYSDEIGYKGDISFNVSTKSKQPLEDTIYDTAIEMI